MYIHNTWIYICIYIYIYIIHIRSLKRVTAACVSHVFASGVYMFVHVYTHLYIYINIYMYMYNTCANMYIKMNLHNACMNLVTMRYYM